MPTKTPLVSGQKITLTATVVVKAPGVGTPNGTVTFEDNGTLLPGTSRALAKRQSHRSSRPSLVAGTHSLTAVYNPATSPTTNFVTSTSTPALAPVIAAAATTTTVTASPNPANFGQSVTFKATVKAASPGSGTPSGAVTFLDNGTAMGAPVPLGSGVATFTTSALTVGVHTITATYSPTYNGNTDSNFTTSSGSVKQTVKSATTAHVTNVSPTSLATSRLGPFAFSPQFSTSAFAHDLAMLSLLDEPSPYAQETVPSTKLSATGI